MKQKDQTFELLSLFSKAATYEIAADGKSVSLTAEDGAQVSIMASTFKNMACVNDVIAQNVRKQNPYAPYDAQRAAQLKPIFADALAQIRQAQWRTRVQPANAAQPLAPSAA